MDIQHVFWWLSIGCECAILACLILRKLAHSYVAFTSYLAFGAGRGIALNFAGSPSSSKTYAVSWMITEPVLLALLIWSTIEIVGKIPVHYAGFGSFGQQKLRRLLDVALVIALLSSVIEAIGPHWQASVQSLLRFLFGLHRITTSALAIYLLLVAVFVSRVRVPFRRNLLIHSRLFAAYLALQTTVTVFLVGIGHGTHLIDEIFTGGSAILFLLWAILLTRRGEALPPRRAVSKAEIVRNEERERALQQTVKRFSDRPLG
jgi:hypothetical protein